MATACCQTFLGRLCSAKPNCPVSRSLRCHEATEVAGLLSPPHPAHLHLLQLLYCQCCHALHAHDAHLSRWCLRELSPSSSTYEKHQVLAALGFHDLLS